ncbi:hypothetical protein F9802_02765 [Bacillus aerolatus]|uniref:Uncharacterized protein n=1 Tax=Bacillus aerolatus TaxID=2653354 RepID=A0A6I1FVV9_9BACI|nr:hypothetical protein [Bacillus aerolatus]KAB7709063.1 hypothetical protein F9802_02765 [Bacillus aerolatus]
MKEFERMMDELKQLIADERRNLHIEIDHEKLSAFKETISELANIKNEYKSNLSQLRNLTEREVGQFEYSKGGETIHRGYYCPSPIYDLIVGNAKRGRLLKKKPEFGKYSYEYGFDNQDRLIRVRGVNEFTTPISRFDEEYLIYEKDIIYSVEFSNTGEINVVSKCTYNDGNIVKYERSLVIFEEDADLHFEKYYYKNNKLSEVSIFQVTPSIEMYGEQKYTVELNEDEQIVKLVGGSIENGIQEKSVFNFKK